MTYQISAGIKETNLSAWLKRAYQKHGFYKGKYVNYTNAKIAPIIMCTVTYGDKILLLKRGYGLADAEGYWSTVNGFIDEVKPVKQIVAQELKEELGLSVDEGQIKIAKSYTVKNPKEKRKYIVFSSLVQFDEIPEIQLNHEHTDYAWVNRSELEDYEILEDLTYAVDAALEMR